MFNIILLGLTSLFTDIASEMVYPLVPFFLTVRLGASPAVLGLIEGLAESVASLLKVFSGYLSDRLHDRKALTIVGYTCSALGKLLLALAAGWGMVLGRARRRSRRQGDPHRAARRAGRGQRRRRPARPRVRPAPGARQLRRGDRRDARLLLLHPLHRRLHARLSLVARARRDRGGAAVLRARAEGKPAAAAARPALRWSALPRRLRLVPASSPCSSRSATRRTPFSCCAPRISGTRRRP